MATVAQGQSQLVNLGPTDAIKVSTPGEAYVDHLSGTPESPYASTRLIKNTEPKVFGPYGVNAKLRVRAIESTALYDGYTDPQPAEITTNPTTGQTVITGPTGPISASAIRRVASVVVNVLDYGADPTGVQLSTAAFQAAAQALRDAAFADITTTGGRFYIPYGKYRINDTISLPSCDIFAEKGAQIFTVGGGTFNTVTKTDAFRMNTVDGVTWEVQHVFIGRQTVTNLRVDNTDNPSLRVNAFKSAGAIVFENFITRYCESTHIRTSNYADHQIMRGVIAEGQTNPDIYALNYEIGDGINFANLAGGRYASKSTDKLARWNNCNGGVIDAPIWAGELKFENCRGIEVRGGHCEKGRISLLSSSLTISNIYFWHVWEDGIPSERIFSAGWSQNQSIDLNQVSFMSFFNLAAGIGPHITINKPFVDVRIAQYDTLNVKNTYRRVSSNSGIEGNQTHGIYVNDSSGTPIATWNEYTWLLSREGRILPNYSVDLNHTWPPGGAKANRPALAYPSTDARTVWAAESGTYYYAMRLYYDRTRLVGRATAPKPTDVISLVQGGLGGLFAINWEGNATGGWVRLYRGTSGDLNYTHYVDIPVVSVYQLFDEGSHVHGYAWVERAAGPVDGTYDLPAGATISWTGVNATVSNASALPTAGTWKAGDKIEFSNGQTYICTVAGTPGTWKPVQELPGAAGATVSYASVMPTAGTYTRGSVVYNSTPDVVSGKILLGWSRLTTGSGHVVGTDWSPIYTTSS